MAKRDKRVIVTLTAEEYEACQRAAQAEDRKLGPWFRWLGLIEAQPEQPGSRADEGVRLREVVNDD